MVKTLEEHLKADPTFIRILQLGIERQLRADLTEAIVMPKVQEYEAKLRENVEEFVKRIVVDRCESWFDVVNLMNQVNIKVVYEEKKP